MTKLIGLVAAMPEEFMPLLRMAGKYKRERIGGFDAYRFSFGDEKLLLVRSGMGLENAAAATEFLINDGKPGFLIHFGFCGGITTGLRMGDIVVAQRILTNREALFSPQSGIDEEGAKLLTRSLSDTLAEKDLSVCGGTFITVAGIRRKEEMSRLVPSWAKNPVLEMETAAVAMTAARKGIPLVAVRCVSDEAGEELGFSIGELTGDGMRIRIGRVLLTLTKKPWIIPQMMRLSRNSKTAGENLALAICAMLEDTAELRMERERPY
jgi:adenosylhomocysteine nucleosidase